MLHINDVNARLHTVTGVFGDITLFYLDLCFTTFQLSDLILQAIYFVCVCDPLYRGSVLVIYC